MSTLSRKAPPWLVALLLIGFGVGQIAISVYKYQHLLADTMDLGYVRQSLWMISHGDWIARSSVFQTPTLAVDGSAWLYPLAYGYRYLGRTDFLFVVQALCTALAGWGIYRIARLKLAPWVAVAVVAAFAFYPALLGGSQFDWHPDFLALPALIWSIYAYRRGRYGWYYAGLIAAVLAKDVALIAIAGWGLGLFAERRWRDGAAAVCLAGIGLCVEYLWLFPLLGAANESTILQSYAYLGSGPFGVVFGAFDHMGRMARQLARVGPRYVLWILGPSLGLTLFGSASLGGAAALMALNAASKFGYQQQITDQYQVLIAGLLAVALAESLGKWAPPWQRRLATAVVSATLIFEGFFVVQVLYPILAFAPPHAIRTTQTLRRMIHAFPAHVVVFTQNTAGVWDSRDPYLGVDDPTTQASYPAPLPVLWREAPPGTPTILLILPHHRLNRYMQVIIHRAQAAGYRAIPEPGGIKVWKGTAHFPVPGDWAHYFTFAPSPW